MDWAWLVDQGLIEGDPTYYANGKASSDEVSNAIKTAYTAADDTQRKKLVDMAWSSGTMEGERDYWYGDKSSEAGDFAAAYSGSGDSSRAGTGQEGGDPRFGLAGGAQLWKNATTGESYIVYQVPGTEDDPVFMRWTVPSEEDVQSFFGPDQTVKYTRTVTDGDAAWVDAIDFGSSTDLANTSEKPFDSWASTLETEAISQPWILDDDYQTLLAMAVVEDRDLTEADIQTTGWWRDNSASKRSWMLLYNSDPSEAAQRIEDNRIKQTEYLRNMGLSEPSTEMVNYMADQVTMGDWSQDEMKLQVQILSDPYFSGQSLDSEFQKFLDDGNISWDSTNDKELEVRNLVTRWLGTNFGEWSDAEVSDWATRLRNEPDAAEALTETLKDQKQALFPEYDREASYETIAAPWRTMIRNAWGEVPNDSDQMLQKVIRMNDASEAGQFLTDEGLKRGNDTVVNTVQASLNNSFGGIAV